MTDQSTSIHGTGFPRRRFLHISGGTALGLALAACSGGTTTGTSSGNTTAKSSDSASSTSHPAKGASRGGTLTLSLPNPISTFDPTSTSDNVVTFFVGDALYQYLVRYDAKLNLYGDAADTWKQPDDLTYEFALRKNLGFSNGAALTGADVKWSYEWQRETSRTWASKLSLIKSIEVETPTSVRITLTEPNAPFLSGLARVPIVSKDTADKLAQNPVGSGPFQLGSATANGPVTYQANPHYWDSKHPILQGVTLTPVPNASVAANRLASGQLDVVTSLPASLFGANTDKAGMKPVQYPSNNLLIVHMAIDKTPALKDVRVRKALDFAFDRKGINKAVFFGLGTPAASPLPEGLTQYYVHQEGHAYSLDMAQRLLEDAGYKSGLSLKILTIAGHDDMKGAASIWQSDLKQIGVTLNIVEYDIATWLKHYYAFDYDLIFNTKPVTGDPDDMFSRIFEPMLTESSGFHGTAYTNAKMLKLIRNGQQTIDTDARKKIYAELQQMTVDDVAPIISFGAEPNLALLSDRVSVFPVNASSDTFLGQAALAQK